VARVSQAAPVFVDTSACVALLHGRDQAHRAAAEQWATLRAGRRRLVTTNLVLTETHTILSRRLGAQAGLAFLDRVAERAGQRIVWADEELTRAAAQAWLRRKQSWNVSLTDAVSFEVMRREGLKKAFTFNSDFGRAGYRATP
jgi:uncharacterized protein